MEYNVGLRDLVVNKERPMIYALAECSITCMNNTNCINPEYKNSNKEEGMIRLFHDCMMQIQDFVLSILAEYEHNEPLFFTDNKVPKSFRVKIDPDGAENILIENEAGEERRTCYMTEPTYYEFKDSEDEEETVKFIYEDLYSISDCVQKIIEYMYNYKYEDKYKCLMFDFQSEEHRAKYYEILNLLGIAKCFTFIKRDDSTVCEANMLELYIDFRTTIRNNPEIFKMNFDNIIERKY